MYIPFFTPIKTGFFVILVIVHCLFLIIKIKTKTKHAQHIKLLHYHDNDQNYSIYSKELFVKLNKFYLLTVTVCVFIHHKINNEVVCIHKQRIKRL